MPHANTPHREQDTPLYSEVEPLGPVDAADAGGDAQLSTAYSRRFIRRLPDGIHYGVIDVECYMVNTNPNTDPAQPVLIQALNYTVCTDAGDPGSSEVLAYYGYTDFPADPEPGDVYAYLLCAGFDPAELTWDGEPL